MKRFAAILCAALLLCGCAHRETPETEPTETVATMPTEPTVPPETEFTSPAETVPPATDPTEPAAPIPNTVALHAAVPIFEGPSYDTNYLRAVGEDGRYTIVEEATDGEGNRWGRLKSGAGWVDLTALEEKTPVTAAFADETALNGGDYIAFIAEESEYLCRIIFRATEPLTGVQLHLLEPDPETGDFTIYRQLYALDSLTPGKPLVAGVVFYGDLTAYGLSFTDASGAARCFAVTVSGRNGAPVLTEIFTTNED